MKRRSIIKLTVNMFEDIKGKIIDTKPERDLIHYVWMRSIMLAGKVDRNGELYVSKNMPFTEETLAIEFNRDIMQVRLALKTLIELEIIEITKENVYKVKNFVKYQGVSKDTENLENKKENDTEKEAYVSESKDIEETDEVSNTDEESLDKKADEKPCVNVEVVDKKHDDVSKINKDSEKDSYELKDTTAKTSLKKRNSSDKAHRKKNYTEILNDIEDPYEKNKDEYVAFFTEGEYIPKGAKIIKEFDLSSGSTV